MAAAQKLGGDVPVLIAGHDVKGAVEVAAKVGGVAKVLAENVEAMVLRIAKDYSHILAAATARGRNMAPRIAAKLDVAQSSDITRGPYSIWPA